MGGQRGTGGDGGYRRGRGRASAGELADDLEDGGGGEPCVKSG
jgi:hypothetical protein